MAEPEGDQPDEFGPCPVCGMPARWTQIRRRPGGRLGNYQCQIEAAHNAENVIYTKDQPAQE